MKRSMWMLLGVVISVNCAASRAQLAEQYPKPLIHTPTDHPAAQVILISVDGLRAIDLAMWVAQHPQSGLAELSGRGVTWTNAHAPWADPAAGLVGLVTGGTPISTGIVSSDGYDRTLSPAGSQCKVAGADVTLHGAIDEDKLPLYGQKNCAAVRPHELLRVNTIFEVVHEKIGATAWAGEDAASTDLMRGPSGKGLGEACGFAEATAEAGDSARVKAVLNWIAGKDCAGTREAATPALYGMSFASLAAERRASGVRYDDEAQGTKALTALDNAVQAIVAGLKARQLYDSTWIVVAGPYGQAPVSRVVSRQQVKAAAELGKVDRVAHVSGGDVAMIWLRDHSDADAVVKALREHAAALGIEDVYAGERLGLTLNLAMKDPRMPDIVLQPAAGVMWGKAGERARAAEGGMADADTHVALVVAGRQLTGRVDKTWVPTTQLAPLLLRAFGMEKFDLWALHPEHTPALPGIF